MKGKIKIIDLINRILLLYSEDIPQVIPEYIKYDGYVYQYDARTSNYYAKDGELELFNWGNETFDILN